MKARDIAFAVLIAFVWALNFIAVKWAVEDFPPLIANCLRFITVLAVFFPFLRIVPGRMKPLLMAAFTLGVAHFGMVFLGMKLAGGVGAVAIASQLNVPFATLLAIFILKETVGWRRILGIGLSFSGVLVLGFDPVIFTYWDGLLVISFAAFLYAVSAILMRQLKDVRAVTVQAWVAVAGISGSLILSSIFESEQIQAITGASPKAWAAVAYSGIASSVIGHGGANYLFRKYDVTVVSPYFLIMPLFAVAAAVVVLGEEVSSKMLLGGSLTIFGILIVTLRNNARAKLAPS